MAASPADSSLPGSPGSPDILLLSLATTLGWRVADAAFVAQLEQAGAAVVGASVRMGASRLLRRAYPVTDMVDPASAWWP